MWKAEFSSRSYKLFCHSLSMLLLERLFGVSTVSPLGNPCLVDLTLMFFPGNVRLSHLGSRCLPPLTEQDRKLCIF
jgi:hypothetical protein